MRGFELGKILRALVIAVIRFYRYFVSPFFPRSCRFYPTCSVYAELAINKYGLTIGGARAVWRILRCNPFNKGGIDLP